MLLTLKCSSSACHFLPVKPKYSPQHSIIENPQPMPLQKRNKIAHQYKKGTK